MGWIYADEAPEHEGYVANVLADGRHTDGSMQGGVLLQNPTIADLASGWEQLRYDVGLEREYVEVVAPWDQVVAWRAVCGCGWTGPSRPAVDDEYGNRDCPGDLEEELFRPAWRAHVAPYVAITELEDLAGQLRSIEEQIAERVRLARTGGASWSRIGGALGVSRQGAQQRWG